VITLDAFGSAVPRRDLALRIEHEDGVVLDALHEQLELVFACSQCLVHGSCLGSWCHNREVLGRPLIALDDQAMTTFAAGSPTPQEAPQRLRTFQVSPQGPAWPFGGALMVRRSARLFATEGRSTMNQQAVQKPRRRGLNIAEAAFIRSWSSSSCFCRSTF